MVQRQGEASKRLKMIEKRNFCHLRKTAVAQLQKTRQEKVYGRYRANHHESKQGKVGSKRVETVQQVHTETSLSASRLAAQLC